MKYLLFGIILCLLSACALTEKTSENTHNVVITRSESAIVYYKHPSVCEDCIHIKPEAGSGTCKHCGNITDSKSYKYCTKCSKSTNTCAKCLAPLNVNAYLSDLLFSIKIKEQAREDNLQTAILYQSDTLKIEKHPCVDNVIYRPVVKSYPGCCSKHQSGFVTCDMSNCMICGASVTSGLYKLCVSCAISRHKCRKCLGPLNF